jgi:hypothetical protein
MTIPIILAIFALAVAAVEEVTTQGRDITAWAVILLAVAFLWGAV